MELAFTESSHVSSVGVSEGGLMTVMPRAPEQIDALLTVLRNASLLPCAACREDEALTLTCEHIRPHEVLDVLVQAGMVGPMDALIAKSNLDAVSAVMAGQYGHARRA